MAPTTPEPKKRKKPSGKSPVVFPISDSPPSPSPRVVARPAARGKAKNVRGTTKMKTCENPVAFTISDFPSSSSSRVVAPPAASGEAMSVSGTRKMKTCENPVVFPISDFPSSSSSRVVTPPAARGKAKSVRGTRKMKTCDNPVVDPIVIGEEECGKPESLESSLSCCDICAETVHVVEMVKVSTECSHSFCASCVIKHVETKILENVTDVKCLGSDCGSVIDVDICRGFLDGKLLERWDKVRCEAAFEEAQKYYCPFKDCSAMLIVDGEAGHSMSECECPYCHRLFCACCRVPWHWKYTCKQFQSMDEDERGNEDVLVKELAEKKKWGRCPKCRFYVERTHGCPHIACRCGFHFCYGCGKEWGVDDHNGCARS